MRPAAILWFERLYLASLAVSLLRGVMWIRASPDPMLSAPTLFLIQGFFLGLFLLLVLLATRRRSRIAKWIIVVFFVGGIPEIASLVRDGVSSRIDALDIVVAAMQAVALALLFSRPGRQWLKTGSKPLSPDALRDTFE